MICDTCGKNHDVLTLTRNGCQCALCRTNIPIKIKQRRRTHQEVVLANRKKKQLLILKREARARYYNKKCKKESN